MKLSIVTINRNNCKGLQQTVMSVLGQSVIDFEYILIDGASTDGSKEYLASLDDKRISYATSEVDNGIYHAMNKGIKKATGDYLLFMNSGDYLVDKNVITEFLDVDFKEDLVCGNVNIVQEGSIALWESKEYDQLDFDLFVYNSLPHQATFIKKSLFDKYGLYNENNKIVSDWEFFMKSLVLGGCSYKHIDRVVANIDFNGISVQPYWKELHWKEKEQLLEKLTPIFYRTYKSKQEELSQLTAIKQEYKNLKSGKFKYIIHLLLFIKGNKKAK